MCEAMRGDRSSAERPQIYWPVHPVAARRTGRACGARRHPGCRARRSDRLRRDGRRREGVGLRADRLGRAPRGSAVSGQAGPRHARRDRAPRGSDRRDARAGRARSRPHRRGRAAAALRQDAPTRRWRAPPTPTATAVPLGRIVAWLLARLRGGAYPTPFSPAPEAETAPTPREAACCRSLAAGGAFAGTAVAGLLAGIWLAERTKVPILAAAGLFAGLALGGYSAFRLLLRSM